MPPELTDAERARLAALRARFPDQDRNVLDRRAAARLAFGRWLVEQGLVSDQLSAERSRVNTREETR